MIDSATRTRVRQRARNRCEYCLISQENSPLSHHIEHIVARKHGGTDDLDNLALACHRCNLHKGSNLTGIDPLTSDIAPLFHPRRDPWTDNFRFRGPEIEGTTSIGRATVRVLSMNDARQIELREILQAISSPNPPSQN